MHRALSNGKRRLPRTSQAVHKCTLHDLENKQGNNQGGSNVKKNDIKKRVV